MQINLAVEFDSYEKCLKGVLKQSYLFNDDFRQFRDTAKERYFKNMNMAIYFHSSIADYYLGIWGGGVPKPFKYTEIQRHR